jgi:hypothetical protein
MAKRRQASLYLTDAPVVERLRARHNPFQAKLIPAHVTLCREDEVSDWGNFEERLKAVSPFSLTLRFGVPLRDGNFVYMPVVEGAVSFQRLRKTLLGGNPRSHSPHLTIVHPRNGTCDDIAFSDIAQAITSFEYTFGEAMLIEEQDDGVWQKFAR